MSTTARLQRLRAEVASDRKAALERIDELAGLDIRPDGEAGELARAAVALHHAYGAVEALLARVARTLGEGEPGGRDWHQELLLSMGLEIEGVRPAVLGTESVRLLRRLLAFRHFFRHAYAVALDPEQLSRLKEDATELRPHLQRDLDRLDAFLARLARTPGA
ncbi:hypothetical protein [Vulgatibacter sp.]|uniref:ribonuclease toxin HepT-like protein n=1 Tax=Vulgatibacter sp. TaxID=1971226 RepID=UPI00356A24C1